jgi:hypothetical protein
VSLGAFINTVDFPIGLFLSDLFLSAFFGGFSFGFYKLISGRFVTRERLVKTLPN